MTAKKDSDSPDLLALTDKLKRLNYPDFETMPGEDKVLMLHIDDYFICSVDYACSLSDGDLLALIEETIG